jgi:hypothetical protein
MDTIWRKEHPSVPGHNDASEQGGYSLSQIRRCFQVLVPVTVAPNVTDPEAIVSATQKVIETPVCH